MSNLTCPGCKQSITIMQIKDGDVRCPHCELVMFTYRQPDENFTPKEFMALLETRGKQAGTQAVAWFPDRHRRIALIRAGLFIAWLWPQLAVIFQEVKE